MIRNVVDRHAHVVQLPQGLLKEGRYLLKAAQDLEQRVRRVASGWETEFAIGMDSMLSPLGLEPDIAAFYAVADQTRLRVATEALSGTWEALLDRRVDLLVGAAGEGPSGGGYIAESIGVVPFVFAVAPTHPLAKGRKVLGKGDLRAHRAIAVADSARERNVRLRGPWAARPEATLLPLPLRTLLASPESALSRLISSRDSFISDLPR